MARSETRDWIRHEVFGLAFLSGSIYLLLSLASFSFEEGAPRNLGGPVGDHLANFLRQSIGLAAFLIPVCALLAGLRLVRNRPVGLPPSRIGGGAALLLFSAILLSLLFPGAEAYRSGGVVGGWVANKLFREELGPLGAWLFTMAGLALALAFALDVSVLAVGRRGAAVCLSVWRRTRARVAAISHRRAARSELVPAAGKPVPEIPPHVPSRKDKSEGVEVAPRPKAPPVIGPKPVQEKFEFVREASVPSGNYRLPALDFLNAPIGTGTSLDKETLLTNSQILEKKLRDFGVDGIVVKVNPGPIVTMFEFEPAPGVKISKIVGLANDLQMALRADSVRIAGPLPGKAVIGIEVANWDREPVSLKQIIASQEFQGSGSKLPLALGKDIFGTPMIAPLEAMPHLLVAGSTGTGKSVFMNAVLMSILFRCTPEDCRLLLVDPKLLEFSVYEGIPHLLTEVVTNPKRAASALQGIVHKMEERNRLMAAKGVRNIDQYNRKMEKEAKEGTKLPPEPAMVEGTPIEFPLRLPYIVVMIDELADLMVVAGREVEESLTRLAQMARAAGIHLVLATQRPSVDVLTGVIKANFPTRVSFQVFSRVDSRTILDQQGAESLLGKGDMLFVPPNTSRMRRIHGAFVSEDEIRRVVEFLKDQGAPTYDESIIRAKEETKPEEEDEADEVYDQAVAVVTEYRQASISFIQRKLRVGYNRAARIMERMEREGIVGPADGTNRRGVLVRDLSERGYE